MLALLTYSEKIIKKNANAKDCFSISRTEELSPARIEITGKTEKMIEQQKYDFKLTESPAARAQMLVNKSHQSPTKSILMPPPNITGNLHIGHSLDLVIQDFIVRALSLQGERVNWISGLDHAGIATQSKLESLGLLNDKVSRSAKNDFAVYEWYPRQKKKIAEQWANLGLFIDYQQDNFTMNNSVQEQVRNFFIALYNDGLIHQSNKVINWDPKLQTAIADIEVDSVESEGTLYYVKYQFEDDANQYLEVATSRPETIFADVALFVNPSDTRYAQYVGLWVRNPLNGKRIKILTSEKVKLDFGTGVLKCTPSHDFDDYEMAASLQLPVFECYDKHGIFNSSAGQWEGKNARASRTEIIQFLTDKNMFAKQENYQTKVSLSQRSGALIEPLVSLQWFLDLPALVAKVEVSNPQFLSQISFLPALTRDKLLVWKANLKEWCISRQLWWGHQIPVAHQVSTSQKEVIEIGGVKDGWEQDPDVLDTWFSSSLWPLIVSSNKSEFIPIDYLVTGSDLLFFWLFKMIAFSFYFHQRAPFQNVLIHGLIKDAHGKKMSKSIGNGVEPEQIISQYGADSLRLFLLSNNNYGSDLKFDEQKLKGGYFFLQKVWSIANFITSNSLFQNLKAEAKWDELKLKIATENNLFSKTLNQWLLSKLADVEEVYLAMSVNDSARFDTALLAKKLIDFTREVVSSSYIYLIKNSTNPLHIELLSYVFQRLLLMLSPLVPFVSSYLYKQLFGCQPSSLPLSSYDSFIEEQIEVVDLLFSLKKRVSSLCKKEKVTSTKINFALKLVGGWEQRPELVQAFLRELMKIDNIRVIVTAKEQSLKTSELLDLYPYGTLHFSLPNDKESVGSKVKSLQFYDDEIKRSLSLLNNPGFLNKSPRELVELEKKKFHNYLDQRAKLLVETDSEKEGA